MHEICKRTMLVILQRIQYFRVFFKKKIFFSPGFAKRSMFLDATQKFLILVFF